MDITLRKNGKYAVWITSADRRITINDVMCYQCTEIKGKLTLIVSVHGGIHMSMPLDPEIALDDLVSLCDRLAFVAWGIHGQYGTMGVEVSEEEIERLERGE